jgi:hypothetical protein
VVNDTPVWAADAWSLEGGEMFLYRDNDGIMGIGANDNYEEGEEHCFMCNSETSSVGRLCRLTPV